MNSRHRLGVWMAFSIAGFAGAQEHGAEGTRQLYYLATPPKDTLPPMSHGTTPPPPAPKAAALHLGLRYNVVLIGKDHNAKQIPADSALKVGDCFAIDLEANRSGYLYVLARQSSGSWLPLLPNPDMPGERNEVEPRTRVRVPKDYCFAINNPPGTETLFVVLSRDPRDFYELYEGIKGKETKPKTSTASSNEMQAASAQKVDAAVEHLDEKFGGSRDISITRIEDPARNDEPRGAVYVVNKSDKPASSLVTKIEVRHK
jgi:hypothetical protein